MSTSAQNGGVDNAGEFLYFAYGSNLLTERIHRNNATAIRKDVAKLEGYELSFAGLSQRWHGAPATIKRQDGGHLWGVVWSLQHTDLKNLDRQEVYYVPLDVWVESADGRKYRCRTYETNWTVAGDDEFTIDVPSTTAKPSASYMEVVLKGAEENGLPEAYIEFLRNIEHNGYHGPVQYDLNK